MIMLTGYNYVSRLAGGQTAAAVLCVGCNLVCIVYTFDQ